MLGREIACQLARGIVARKLDVLERRLAGRTYLVGERFTMADCAWYTRLDLCPALGIPLPARRYPNLLEWQARIGERPAALMVPEEAIVPLGDDFFVYTVADGKAKRVRVKLGVRRDAMVELLEGVKAGDLVVTAGMRVSRDGQPVRVVNAAAAAAAEAKPAAAATK